MVRPDRNIHLHETKTSIVEDPLFKHFDRKFEVMTTKLEGKIDDKFNVLSGKLETLNLKVEVLPKGEAFEGHKKASAEGDRKISEQVAKVSTQVAAVESEVKILKNLTRDEKTFEIDVLAAVSKSKEKSENWFKGKVGLLQSTAILVGFLLLAVNTWNGIQARLQQPPQEQGQTKFQN